MTRYAEFLSSLIIVRVSRTPATTPNASFAVAAAVAAPRPRRHRRSVAVFALYVLALMREFRWTLAAMAVAVAVGTLVFALTPVGGQRPSWATSLYGGWMALLAQPLYNPPPTAWIAVLCALYPLVGAIVIGEGVVRLALLMMSRRRGEKEWVRVMVSTFRDHVVVCGLGHLGVRVVEQLVAGGVDVVALERRKAGRFVSRATELNVPVVFGDMKADQTLIDAGIRHARAIVIATNDAMSNLEVALDAKRMNPDVRVVMRMFDEQVAGKISGAMNVDVAFSTSTLAAGVVAAMALQPAGGAAGGGGGTAGAKDAASAGAAKVLSSLMIGGACHVAAEVTLPHASHLVGRRIDDVERSHGARVLARTNGSATQSPPPPETILTPGDRLVVHAPAQRIAEMTI